MAEVIDFGAGTLSNSGIPMPCLVLPRALAELRQMLGSAPGRHATADHFALDLLTKRDSSMSLALALLWRLGYAKVSGDGS